MTVITATNTAQIKLLSRVIFLDNLIIKKLHIGKRTVFMPKGVKEKISFKIPAKIANPIAQLNSKDKLPKTMLIKIMSGLTLNILKEFRTVICKSAAILTMIKKRILSFMV